jgi:hypothetical protein
MRTLPMVALPLMLPLNMDLLFAIFAVLFYGYGVYLHLGYETPYLSAHNPLLNTSYHHYLYVTYHIPHTIYTVYRVRVPCTVNDISYIV